MGNDYTFGGTRIHGVINFPNGDQYVDTFGTCKVCGQIDIPIRRSTMEGNLCESDELCPTCDCGYEFSYGAERWYVFGVEVYEQPTNQTLRTLWEARFKDGFKHIPFKIIQDIIEEYGITPHRSPESTDAVGHEPTAT